MPDRPTSLVFDRIADQYDDTRGGLARGVVYADALSPLFGHDGRTLELGVGTGVVAVELRGRGRDIVGVDLSEPMLYRAHERLGARVALADVQRLPLGDGSVDDAYACWVLHLVSDVAATLAEVRRVLRPGGRLVVITSRPTDARADVDQITVDLQRRLRGGGEAQDHPPRLESLAGGLGFTVLPRSEVSATEHTLSPTEQADRLEQRIYSCTWDVDGQTWQRAVVPAIAALRALPDPDQPREDVAPHPIVVLGRR
jgi:SAM-dependent methyltransferase